MPEQATVVEPAAPVPPPAAAPPSRDRAGWFGVAAITALVAVTWAPLLTTRYGDNHYGRVSGRYALQLRNLFQDGLFASSFGADWSPYGDTPYAHHPPLPNILAALFGSWPGEHEWEVRAGPYLFALAAIPAAALVLRGLRLGWGPTLLATGTMAATGYYWIYSQLMFDLGVILAFMAVVVQLRQRPSPPRWLLVVGCVLGLLAAVASWPGMAFAAGLVLWLVIRPGQGGRWLRLDRVTVAVGVSVLVGLVVSLAYTFGVRGVEDLANQTELRTAGGGFTASEFLNRQWRWFTELLPTWYLALYPLAILAGLADRRTRYLTALSTVFAAGWVLVLNNGSYVHDYWAFLVLVPGVIGAGALFDLIWRRVPSRAAVAGAAAVGVGLVATFGTMVLGPTSQNYLYRPLDAGEVAVAHTPAAGQEFAWHTGLPVPRWLAYYWDLHPEEITEELLMERAQPADLVLVNLRRAPGWFPEDAPALTQEGRYAVYRVADLRAALGADPG